MNYRLAKSLEQLRTQIDSLYPHRSKVSDGWIADYAHSQRVSDHNPDQNGIVKAIDITHDPENGIDGNLLAQTLSDSGDKRIRYLIWNERITVKGDITKWKHYAGFNAHRHHVHISVVADPKLYDDDADWKLNFANPVIAPNLTGEIPGDAVLVKIGSRGEDVRSIQKRLFDIKFIKADEIDGFFGTKTEAAVKEFQHAAGLPDDGIVGMATRAKLFEKF